MATDALAPSVTRASAAIILTKPKRDNSLPTRLGLSFFEVEVNNIHLPKMNTAFQQKCLTYSKYEI